MSRKTKKRTMKRQVTRNGRLLGGYVPNPVVEGIEKWIQMGDERDLSTFIREAAREKLRRENISFSEKQEVTA